MKPILLACLCAAVSMAAHGEALAKKLNVVASFTIIADMVQQVGGDHVDVVSLVQSNGDPHAFEPSPDDARRLRNADLVFVNGLGLEGWLDRLIAASGFKGKPIVTTQGVPALVTTEHGKASMDPHAWNSAANAVIYARVITKALEDADPEDAADFAARGAAYVERLQALDAYARREIEKIPQAKRKVITTHDALGYFGRAYGVLFLSAVGLSTETEASAADVAKLIRQIRSEGVHAYFLENSNDPRLVRQIASATGAQPGGELYVESLSQRGDPADTYETMFRYNVNQLVAAMKK